MRLLYALVIVLLPNTQHLPSRVAVVIAVGLLSAALLLGTRDPPQLPRNSVLAPPLIGLFVAVLLGSIASQWSNVANAGAGMHQLQTMILYPFLYLAYRRSGLDTAATRQLILLVLAAAVLAALEAIWQGYKFDLGDFDPMLRATGPFLGAPNRAGVFFAMFLPMLVALALQPNLHKLARWLAAVAGAILVVAILLTFSRQAYLIASLGILFLLLRRNVLMATLAALVVVTCIGLLPDGVVQRVLETRQVDATGTASYDPSTTSRLKIWQGALAMLADHPWGVGPGRFTHYIGAYTGRPGIDAHNGFLLVLAECGPLGLAMLLWLFWRLWTLAGRLRREVGPDQPEARAFAIGFTLSVVSIALGNLYGSPFMTVELMANFWILCGLVERYHIITTYAATPPLAHGQPRLAASLGARLPLSARRPSVHR